MSLLPRILAGAAESSNGDLGPRFAAQGSVSELRRWAPERLIDEIERSGVRGRGGAAFPVARKMRAVAARRGPRAVVGNGTEGEPASGKDRLLLTELPHLVLDGATRFVASAPRVFADDFEDHFRRGPCKDCAAPPILPVPLAMV